MDTEARIYCLILLEFFTPVFAHIYRAEMRKENTATSVSICLFYGHGQWFGLNKMSAYLSLILFCTFVSKTFEFMTKLDFPMSRFYCMLSPKNSSKKNKKQNNATRTAFVERFFSPPTLIPLCSSTRKKFGPNIPIRVEKAFRYPGWKRLLTGNTTHLSQRMLRRASN